MARAEIINALAAHNLPATEETPAGWIHSEYYHAFERGSISEALRVAKSHGMTNEQLNLSRKESAK